MVPQLGFGLRVKGFGASGGRGFGVLDGENWGLEMNGGWGKEILCNRVSLGMIGKSLLSIAVEGAGFAVVHTRHVPHMFYDLGQ